LMSRRTASTRGTASTSRSPPRRSSATSFTFIKELCGEYSSLFYELQRRLSEAAIAGSESLAAFEIELAGHEAELAESEASPDDIEALEAPLRFLPSSARRPWPTVERPPPRCSTGCCITRTSCQLGLGKTS
jgi:hypothetical protein